MGGKASANLIFASRFFRCASEWRKMMDIRSMEYYLAITREGNISAAAKTLHISQPALSRQIRELEAELGVTLFERGSRKIRLTEEGMILRRRAEELVHLMQITEIRPLEDQISQPGTIIWKKYDVFTPAVNLFLEELKGL